jgi:hypothetical protein
VTRAVLTRKRRRESSCGRDPLRRDPLNKEGDLCVLAVHIL